MPETNQPSAPQARPRSTEFHGKVKVELQRHQGGDGTAANHTRNGDPLIQPQAPFHRGLRLAAQTFIDEAEEA